MIRLGIAKEFSLDVSMMMMDQLEEAFGKGIHSYFTDTGVYFSIEAKPLLVGIYNKFLSDGGFLNFYRWNLVIGDNDSVSREFKLGQFVYYPVQRNRIIVFPYILDSSNCIIFDNVPHASFDFSWNLIKVEIGKDKTEEDILGRLRAFGLIKEK